MTDKENLLANEDRFNLIYENLKNKLQNSSISINLDEIIITINSDNPDPIEISNSLYIMSNGVLSSQAISMILFKSSWFIFYLGCILIAPSNLIVSPFKKGFSIICATNLANSSG